MLDIDLVLSNACSYSRHLNSQLLCPCHGLSRDLLFLRIFTIHPISQQLPQQQGFFSSCSLAWWSCPETTFSISSTWRSTFCCKSSNEWYGTCVFSLLMAAVDQVNYLCESKVRRLLQTIYGLFCQCLGIFCQCLQNIRTIWPKFIDKPLIIRA